MKSAKRFSQCGFSLIELLVAITVTVLLAGLLITVTSGAINIWGRSQSNLTTNSQAKIALDLLVRDLQAAVRSTDTANSFAVDVLSSAALNSHNWRLVDPRMKPADTISLQALANTNVPADQRISEARFGQSGIWLRFITTNVETGGSLPTAVSYQIIRRPVSGTVTGANLAPIRYTLYRTKVGNDDTFRNGYDMTSSAYTDMEDAALADALCDNVVDFGVWCYAREVDGTLTRLYPDADKDRMFRGFGQASAAEANRYPDVVDVMLRVLSESGAEQLEQIELGRVSRPPEYTSDDLWWWGIVNAESRVFTTRVEVGSSQLP